MCGKLHDGEMGTLVLLLVEVNNVLVCGGLCNEGQ